MGNEESEFGKRRMDDRSPQHDQNDPARKVMRNGSDMDSSFDFCQRLTDSMDKYKAKVSATLTLMDMESNPGPGEFKTWMMALARTQVGGMDDMACLVTEMYSEIERLEKEVHGKEKEIRMLKEDMTEQGKVVKAVVVTKDKMEVKASSKEMEEKLKVAVTQFKVMDIDIGKETENRTEIIGRGLAGIKAKVRSDYQEEWAKLVDGVEVAPLVRKTTKPTGKDYYSAPPPFYCAGQDQEMEDGGDPEEQPHLSWVPLASGDDAGSEGVQDRPQGQRRERGPHLREDQTG